MLQELADPDDTDYIRHSEQAISHAMQNQLIVAVACIDLSQEQLGHHDSSSILALKSSLLCDHPLEEHAISHTESGQIWCTLTANTFEDMFRAVVGLHLTVITPSGQTEKVTGRFVGVALAPEHGCSMDELTRKSAIAALQAHQKPGKIRFFSPFQLSD